MDVPLNRALGHLDTQLEQFPSDAFGAPGAIILRHGLDEPHDILGQGLSAFLPLASGLVSPHTPREISVPTQQRFRLNDHESRLPGWELPGDEDKQYPVTPGETRAFHVPL